MNLADYVGCSDCQTVWNGFCYVCKQKVPDYRELKKSNSTDIDKIKKPQPLKPKRNKYSKGVQKLVDAGHKPECVCCGNNNHLTYDHIKPKWMGGGFTVGNGQILCKGCNAIKGGNLLSVEELKKELTKSE